MKLELLMRSFVICTPYKIIVGRWDGQDTQNT